MIFHFSINFLLPGTFGITKKEDEGDDDEYNVLPFPGKVFSLQQYHLIKKVNINKIDGIQY